MDKIKMLSENILENENIVELIPESEASQYISFLENKLLPFIILKYKDYDEKSLLKKSIKIFKIILSLDSKNKLEKFDSLLDELK